MLAVPTIHEYVGLPINELFACGLLCEFRPGLVAKTYPVKEPITAKRQSSRHTFLIRYPDKIVRMDAEVHVVGHPLEDQPGRTARDRLGGLPRARAAVRRRTDEGTPEFYDILCNVERGLASATAKAARPSSTTTEGRRPGPPPPQGVINVTRVVNAHREPYDVLIARPSKWGNPFQIGRDGNRDQVIKMYEVHVRRRPDLIAALPELAGKRLGCYCKPLSCHGDVLVKLLRETNGGELDSTG